MKQPLVFLLLSVSIGLAALPEPDIVFYGRVVHLGGGEEYLVTSGELEWQIDPLTPSQYTRFEAKTSLAALDGGSMSYAIRIPNHLVLEDTVTGVLPGLALPGHQEVPFKNTLVTINGNKARLADPDEFRFGVSSNERGAFRRLDLIYDGLLPDADRDGLPDWWEEKYGTDGQLANSSGDLDGDGVSNLDEYVAGTDPSREDVRPRIASEVLINLPIGGGAVPTLRAIDGDSEPHDLVYVAGRMPAGVTIEILGRPQLWTLSFTQADVNAGRVILRHSGASGGDFSVNLTLRDEDPDHPIAKTTLRLSVGEAASLWEGWGLAMDARPSALPIIQDASRLSGGVTLRAPSSDATSDDDADEPRLYLGSPEGDRLLGSVHGDLFVASDGDMVRGGRGADRFLLGQASGLVSLEDFSVEEADVIDLRGLLEPDATRSLRAYVRRVGQDLMIDADGDGSGYDDLTVRFIGDGEVLDPAELWDLGLLEVGEIVPETTLFLAVFGSAEEEGPRAATVTLRRRGDVRAPLQVPLVWSGTAVLGRDYASIPSVATFKAGEKSVDFVIQPLVDDERETDETVQVELGSSDDWVIADGSRTASLQISDLPSRVWLEVVERVAYRSGASPAQVLVRRRGPMNAPLTVSLAVTGTAAASVDYQRLPASVTFGVAQDVVVLDLAPLGEAGTSMTDDVLIKLKEDPNYLFGESTEANLVILDRPRTISEWMTANAITDSEDVFLGSDADGDGMSGLLEFAFGGSPNESDHWNVKGLVNAEGCVGISYLRWVGAPEIAYHLSQSADLVSWDSLPPSAFQETVTELLPNGMERVEVYLKEPTERRATYLKIDVR